MTDKEGDKGICFRQSGHVGGIIGQIIGIRASEHPFDGT